MSNRLANPAIQFLDTNGNPASGGFLFTYLTGTSTKSSTYSDAALTTPNANPIVLDSAGRAGDVFLDPTKTLKMILAPSTDSDPPTAPIWTRDPVVDLAANVTAVISVYAGDPNGNVAGSAGAVGGAGASMIYDITNQVLYICTTTGTTSTAAWTQVTPGVSGSEDVKTDDYTVVAADAARIITASKATAVTFSLTAASAVGAGFLCSVKNIGVGVLTIDPDGAETIDGSSTIRLNQYDSAILYSTGSTWRMLVQPANQLAGPNLLHNGGFQVAQRGAGPFTSATTPANNDDTYLLDGVILLSDGNDIVDVSRVADTDFVSGWALQFDVETANKKFGALFPIEQANIRKAVAEGTASLQFKVKLASGSSIANIRAYVLSWSGTADAITSDVVSAWNGAGADPTFVANWTAENVAASIAISGTVATVKIENVAVDTAGVKNLAVLIITDDVTTTVGDLLRIGDVQLEAWGAATAYEHRQIGVDLGLCQRYYYQQSSELAGYTAFGLGQITTTSQLEAYIELPVPMRASPTLSTVGGASDFAAYSAGVVTAGTSGPTINTVNANLKSLTLLLTTGATLTAGRAVSLISNNNIAVALRYSAEL